MLIFKLRSGFFAVLNIPISIVGTYLEETHDFSVKRGICLCTITSETPEQLLGRWELLGTIYYSIFPLQTCP